jgi:large subunit ribosomal protein L13
VKTFVLKNADVDRKWLLVDAKGKVLGRLASQIANLLRGKHKPTFQPTLDMGDFVVVINAGQITLTGAKPEQKFAYWHSGYPNGLRAINYRDMLAQKPDQMLWLAVKRMLPRNKLRKIWLRKLKVYANGEHPHTAQQPEKIEISHG